MKIRKKPVVVEVVRWTGENLCEIQDFVGSALLIHEHDVRCGNVFKTIISGISIRTLEGEHIATIGDYIIKGVQGEFYPCKPDIFAETYEVIEDEN